MRWDCGCRRRDDGVDSKAQRQCNEGRVWRRRHCGTDSQRAAEGRGTWKLPVPPRLGLSYSNSAHLSQRTLGQSEVSKPVCQGLHNKLSVDVKIRARVFIKGFVAQWQGARLRI